MWDGFQGTSIGKCRERSHVAVHEEVTKTRSSFLEKILLSLRVKKKKSKNYMMSCVFVFVCLVFFLVDCLLFVLFFINQNLVHNEVYSPIKVDI